MAQTVKPNGGKYFARRQYSKTNTMTGSGRMEGVVVVFGDIRNTYAIGGYGWWAGTVGSIWYRWWLMSGVTY